MAQAQSKLNITFKITEDHLSRIDAAVDDIDARRKRCLVMLSDIHLLDERFIGWGSIVYHQQDGTADEDGAEGGLNV